MRLVHRLKHVHCIRHLARRVGMGGWVGGSAGATAGCAAGGGSELELRFLPCQPPTVCFSLCATSSPPALRPLGLQPAAPLPSPPAETPWPGLMTARPRWKPAWHGGDGMAGGQPWLGLQARRRSAGASEARSAGRGRGGAGHRAWPSPAAHLLVHAGMHLVQLAHERLQVHAGGLLCSRKQGSTMTGAAGQHEHAAASDRVVEVEASVPA